jgi:chromatin assembly factor 1 subunit B
MKVFPQEVYLHGLGKLPDYCYSVDISWLMDEVYLVTGGADSIARIWKLTAKTSLEIHSELTGHQLGVNCVRFSPDGRNSIATASDDGKVVVWHYQAEESNRWIQGRVLNVLDEVVGVAWSPCGTMIAAAVQREMTHIFNASTGRLLARLDGHTNRVAGVCWDPLGGLIVSQSSDRTARVYAKKKNGTWYAKALLKEVETTEEKAWKLFMSESHYPNDPTAHFFRRPEFSPDGSMVVLSGGLSEPDENGSAKFVTHLYSRKSLCTGSSPSGIFTTPCSPGMAVRFHPRRWTNANESFYVFVITTVNSFYVVRSDRSKPVAFGTDLHCTAIVDASWSSDGQLLALCSTDGYMTLVRFEHNELGGAPDWSEFSVVEKQHTVPENAAPVFSEEPLRDSSKRRITPVIVPNNN